MPFALIVIVLIILACISGVLTSHTRIGFIGGFVLAIVCTPVVLIPILLLRPRPNKKSEFGPDL